jgi:hypothetical protein
MAVRQCVLPFLIVTMIGAVVVDRRAGFDTAHDGAEFPFFTSVRFVFDWLAGPGAYGAAEERENMSLRSFLNAMPLLTSGWPWSARLLPLRP